MDKLFIVANLKSYKTQSEAKEWLEIFVKIDKTLLEDKTIIICPPFTLFETFKTTLSRYNLNVKLGAQNVSPFNEGPYTGEVNAKQIKEFADYVLIGHSERRRLLNETDDMVLKKVQEALVNNLTPLFFVQTTDMQIPAEIELIVYEPPDSISGASGGIPDDAEDVLKSAEKIKEKGQYQVLYGGSINSANVKDFTIHSNVSGVVVGKESLNAQEFIKIIKNA